MKTPIALAAATLASTVLLAQSPPQFKVAVEYVEVEARVLDGNGEPLRHLTRDSFQLLEGGEAQNITDLTEIVLPLPPNASPRLTNGSPAMFVTPDVSTNAFKPGARMYLLLVDDAFVAAERTPFVRQLLKQFVERHLGSDDLVAVSTTGRSTAFQNFTNNRAMLGAAIDRLAGDKDPSPTIASMTSVEARAAMAPGVGRAGERGAGGGAAGAGSDIVPPTTPVAEKDKRILKAKSAQEGLLRTIAWMAGLPARSKGIILVSEGVPLDELNDLEGVELAGEARNLTEASRRGGVPVYTVDPRGLTSLSEESIQVGTVSADTLKMPTAGLRAELVSSQEGLRRLAEDTGGIAAVGTNDFAGAFDGIVRQASSYYLLGYSSSNPRADGKFRRIQVKVAVPGARIVARSGYTASSGRPPAKASFPGPSGASPLAREALSSPQPMTIGLILSATAAAFKGTAAESSVAIVLESSGADLALTERDGTHVGTFEVLVAALESRGAIKASEAKALQFNLPVATFERVQQHGLRWLTRLNLRPGRYQIRIAAVSGSSKQGSVWYDLDVPELSGDALSMSGVLIAAASAFQTPTVRPDKSFDGVLPGPPTTRREFPTGDEVTVFAEVYDRRLSEPRDLEVSVQIRTDTGREVFRKGDTIGRDQLKTSRGVYRSITPLTLHVLPGNYVLTIEARHVGGDDVVRRVLPFRVRAGSQP